MPELFSVLVAAPDPRVRQRAASALAQRDDVWCVVHVGALADLLHWTATIQPDFAFLAEDLGAGPLTLAWLCDRSPDTRFLSLSNQNPLSTLGGRLTSRPLHTSASTASAA